MVQITTGPLGRKIQVWQYHGYRYQCRLMDNIKLLLDIVVIPGIIIILQILAYLGHVFHQLHLQEQDG